MVRVASLNLLHDTPKAKFYGIWLQLAELSMSINDTITCALTHSLNNLSHGFGLHTESRTRGTDSSTEAVGSMISTLGFHWSFFPNYDLISNFIKHYPSDCAVAFHGAVGPMSESLVLVRSEEPICSQLQQWDSMFWRCQMYQKPDGI